MSAMLRKALPAADWLLVPCVWIAATLLTAVRRIGIDWNVDGQIQWLGDALKAAAPKLALDMEPRSCCLQEVR